MTANSGPTLVTGGAGFIGSALVRMLADADSRHITVVDNMSYAATRDSLAKPLAANRAELIIADICDTPRMLEILTKLRPETIFHLAAETHVDRSIGTPDHFVRSNVVGSFSLLEAFRTYYFQLNEGERRRVRFIHVSTDEVFGSLSVGDPAFCPETAYDPSSPYSASKAASDHLARAWQRTYGLPVIVTNCSNNYGPFQFPEKLIPLMIINALSGMPLPVYGGGENVRDWLHVDDHARALICVAERGRLGETYLIGARNELTNIRVVRAICATLDTLKPRGSPHEKLIRYVADRPGHDLRYAVNPAKLENELNWKPEVSFEGGLRDTVQWYIDRPDWWQPLRERVYGGERLGLIESSVVGESFS